MASAGGSENNKDLFIPVSLSNPVFDEICNKIYEEYKEACIMDINLINNPKLEEYYQLYKQQLMKKHNVTEDKIFENYLFHGTNKDVMRIIATEGFRIEKNTTSAFGKGTYLATNPSLSFKYYLSKTKTPKPIIKGQQQKQDIIHLFYCKLCSYNCGFVDGTSVVKQKLKKSKLVDTFVNDIRNPKIFVARESFQAIPCYVVTFYNP